MGDYKAVLGSCGDFPFGYVGEKVKPCIFFKLNNIWGWEPKPVQCGDPKELAQDGEPFDLCPTTLTKHMASASPGRRRGRTSGLTATAGMLLTRKLWKDVSPISQHPERSLSATSPTWARGTRWTRTSDTTPHWWRSRWSPSKPGSWCTWSAAPTTAGSSTTRRTSSASSSSRCRSCKRERLTSMDSKIGASETRL